MRVVVRRNFSNSLTGVTGKQTTGIVGLPVDHSARETLINICQDILVDIQGVPQDAPYRQNVESIYNHRLKLAQKETDVTKIEGALGLGHIEEVLEMAKDEQSSIPKYINGRMWEQP